MFGSKRRRAELAQGFVEQARKKDAMGQSRFQISGFVGTEGDEAAVEAALEEAGFSITNRELVRDFHMLFSVEKFR